jgi:mono/diheme cytochrome c family protein
MHPTFVNKTSGMSGADSWRCVSCHGWDYKGNNGFVGIAKSQGKDPATIVALLKNTTHRFDEQLRERDVIDLANFVSKGQLPANVLTATRQRASTDAVTYGKIFSTMCANCHGQDGSQLREVAPLGDSARQRPAEVLHVIVNGHPGGEMPALSVLGVDVAVKMLGHLQTQATLNLPASIAHGGRLYDDWQAETGAQRQSLPHPAYPRNGFYANDAALTWRCTACHGWDYQGNLGDYAKGRHATGIKGIRAMAGVEPARIEAVLGDATHRYNSVLKRRDLQDLANFVSAGQVDMDASIDRSKRSVRGDATRGGAYFRTLCASCHSLDGQSVGVPPLGRVVRANPWGALHSILNGHPSEKMPALRELEAQLLADILAYAQTLPDTR